MNDLLMALAIAALVFMACDKFDQLWWCFLGAAAIYLIKIIQLSKEKR